MTMNTGIDFAPPPPELEADQEWHVFLSYRSVDRPWVINLYDVLRHHGYKVFLDQVAFAPGDLLITQLSSNLKRSAAGILVWSDAARDSTWVEQEYLQMQRMSIEGDFRFIPILVDESPLPGFADSHTFLDFSRYPDGPNGGELLRLLFGLANTPMSPAALRFATAQDEAATTASNQIEAAIAAGNVARLVELADNTNGAWSASALGCHIAEGLVRLGDPNAALQILAPLTRRFPKAVRPRQLRAHALSRRGDDGDIAEAQLVLGELEQAGEEDSETLGMYARTWMDRYAASGRRAHLERSRDLYARAFARARDDYYVGINAAAKSALLGDAAAAETHARAVLDIVGREPVPGDYWQSATVAEAHLLVGDVDLAAERYRQAVAIAPDESGSHSSTRKQAERLITGLDLDEATASEVLAAFE